MTVHVHHVHALADALNGVTIGTPVCVGSLTVFPLLGSGTWSPNVLTLEDAVRRSALEIHEHADGATIDSVRLINHADEPVLLLEGDMLLGGKANRALNTTVLVAPHCTQTIPVSCIEVGRWGGEPKIKDVASNAPLRVRAAISCSVSLDLAASRYSLRTDPKARRSDQRLVWRRAVRMLEAISEGTTTIDLTYAYAHHAALLRSAVHALPPLPYQVGAIFASPCRGLMAIELSADAATFARLLPRLIESSLIEVLIPGPLVSIQSATDAGAKALLAELLDCELRAYPGVGLGDELRVKTRRLLATALLDSDRLLHLSACVRPPGSRADTADD